jgi:hypothetical protein
MNRRETGFLLIGLSLGLSFSIVTIVNVLASLHSLGMIVAYSWERIMLSVPIALLIVGALLLLIRPKRKAS